MEKEFNMEFQNEATYFKKWLHLKIT